MKNILDQYFFKEFVKYFIGSLTLLAGVALISKTMERLPVLINSKAPLIEILLYLAYHVPYFFMIVGAPSLMFAVAFNISVFTKNKELVVVLAAGRSFNRIIAPILSFSLLLSLAFFFFSEYIAYPLMLKSTYQYEYIQGKERYDLYGNRYNYNIKIANLYLHAGKFTADNNLVTNFHAMNTKNGIVRKIYESKYAIIHKGKWILLDGTLTTFNKNGEYTGINHFPHLFLSRQEGPEIMRTFRLPLDLMSYLDLKMIIEKKKRIKEDYLQYEVELQWHYSFPLICFVVVFIAASLGAHVKKGAMSASIGIATTATLGYYVIMFLGKSLATTGLLSPFLGAWLANIVFFIISIFILFKQR